MNPQVAIAIGLKEQPRHRGFIIRDCIDCLIALTDRHFVFYDTTDKRAWLVDAFSTVLHLVRAFLHDVLSSSVKILFGYKQGDIEELAQDKAYRGAESSLEVLKMNMDLPLYRKQAKIEEQTTTKAAAGNGARESPTEELKTLGEFVTLGDLVQSYCEVLLDIIHHHENMSKQPGVDLRIKSQRHRIAGFQYVAAFLLP